MKKVKSYDPFYFQILMCLAIFLSSLVVSFFNHSFIFSYLAILSGFLWSMGNIISALAVKHTGLSKAAPIWMGMAIIISFLWGIIFFMEPFNFLVMAAISLALLIGGIIIVSSLSQDQGESKRSGVFLAAISGILFGSYLVPFKYAQMDPFNFIFSMSIGILLGGLSGYLYKKPAIDRKIILPGILSGIIWNVANISSFFAVTYLGIALGFPLGQLALFVSILWGVVYFHEIKGNKQIIKLITGAIILFSGAILLTLSR